MDIKPKYFWIAGISLYLIAILSAVIWPPQEPYHTWEQNYIYDLMEAHTGIPIDSADRIN